MVYRPRVALLVETSNEYGRGILRGISRYVREAGPWSLRLVEQGRGAEPPEWLSTWAGEGLIARVENEAVAAAVRRTGLPVVDVSAARLLPEAPWVEVNEPGIARVAAQHFVERGFRNLAFVGDARFNWARWRGEAFRAAALAEGRSFQSLELSGSGSSSAAATDQRELEEFLAQLPAPTGVMTCYDPIGLRVLDACRKLDIAVPESLAVVSVDDDELLCGLADPPLTSIVPDSTRTGYRAAELLHRLMRGETVADLSHLVDPIGVSTRQSSDVLAIDDAEVARALNAIKKRACEGIQVKDVLESVPLSRRALETRFRKSIGRSPHEEITRVRMERVRELLVGTDLSIAAIAARTGFQHVEYLSVAFRREVGVPPSVYRARASETAVPEADVESSQEARLGDDASSADLAPHVLTPRERQPKVRQ